MGRNDRLDAKRYAWLKLPTLLAVVFAIGLLTAAAAAANGHHHGGDAAPASTGGGGHTHTGNGTTTATGNTHTGKTTTTAPATTAPAPVPAPPGSYPLHTNIVSTTFWVGEIFNASIADGSQVCSTYDSQWAYHWSGGVNVGTDPSTDCSGAPIGGCDGQPSGSGSTFKCATEARVASNGYFPKNANVHPAENPFYLDLPFDDVNDSTAFKERCQVIPWAAGSSQCSNQNYSFMKNHWVAITGPNGSTCYGQVEDAGPSHGSLYHDAAYVFGTGNVQPVQGQFNNAGMDVSPALNGCLGFKELDGDSDKVSWRFVDAPPAGPWTKIVTTRQAS
jgi:hypothetical protein